MRRPDAQRRRGGHVAPGRRGAFTLVELLVVILIILLVSAVALPTVISSFNHREVSEAARILQGGLVGARDIAINTNAPAGIRLLPDPQFNGIIPSGTYAGTLDPRLILASNRYVPIQLAPDYTEGRVTVIFGAAGVPYNGVANANAYFPYPNAKGGGYYPAGTNAMLYVVQQVANPDPPSYELNPPTSWYWNVRVGDRIQINNSGAWYTIVGPMSLGPDQGNSEGFVNVGPPGTTPPTLQVINGVDHYPEILFLVNGVDDNKDGYIDNGFDGIDNDGDGIVDQVTNASSISEWVETESWPTHLRGLLNVPYTIARRPVVSPTGKETQLPGSVVIDLTYAPGYPRERSRLPVDAMTGYVDVLLYPNGQVVPTTEYSSFTSFGMDSAFYHFWISERSDLYPININPSNNVTIPYTNGNPSFTFVLPMPYGAPYHTAAVDQPNYYDTLVTNTPTLPVLKGEMRLLTLNTRTGQTTISTNPPFNVANPNQPFLQPQQGARGGQ